MPSNQFKIAAIALSMLLIAGCGPEPSGQESLTEPPASLPPSPIPTSTSLPTPTPTPLPTETPEPTVAPTETPTPSPTSTPLPPGYVLVPEVMGMHYRDARNEILRAGLNFVYRDVFDLDHDTGTVIIQDPPPGTGRPRDSLVFLYRSFQAPPAIVGDICYPLRLITTGGKLLFYVDLEQDWVYEIRTGFPYGETQISDTQMFLLASFDNHKKDSLLFTAPYAARYVISLGPYSISDETLKANPGGVNAGCLWVIPQKG